MTQGKEGDTVRSKQKRGHEIGVLVPNSVTSHVALDRSLPLLRASVSSSERQERHFPFLLACVYSLYLNFIRD